MSKEIDILSYWKRPALARVVGVALGASLVFLAPTTFGARAQQSHPNAAPAAQRDSKTSMTKFEARRIRHTCQEKANERGAKGADRDAFLTRCFFGRRALRGVRRDCAKQGAAKGLDKAALRDFTRDCVKEQRAKQKLPE